MSNRLLISISVAILCFSVALWIRTTSTVTAAVPDIDPTAIQIWEEREMIDGSHMARCAVPGGWVVFVSKETFLDGGVSTSLLFVPDADHVWIFK